MKIAIISDTHDNLHNFTKFAKYAAELGVEAVIHCGDVASPETFGEIVKILNTRDDASRVKVFLALGNMDAGRGGEEAYLKAVGVDSVNGGRLFLKTLSQARRRAKDAAPAGAGSRGSEKIIFRNSQREKINVKVFENIGEVEIDGIKTAFGHEPKKMLPVAVNRKYHFVFYGHTHKPWMDVLKNDCIFANPGNLSDSGYLSTFAILDTETKKLELKILKDTELLSKSLQ